MIKLNSVGTAFCPKCTNVCPIFEDGSYDTEEKIPLEDIVNPEWWSGLSRKDFNIVKKHILGDTLINTISEILEEVEDAEVTTVSEDGCITSISITPLGASNIEEAVISFNLSIDCTETGTHFFLVTTNEATGLSMSDMIL